MESERRSCSLKEEKLVKQDQQMSTRLPPPPASYCNMMVVLKTVTIEERVGTLKDENLRSSLRAILE